jgi:hypothetical protein
VVWGLILTIFPLSFITMHLLIGFSILRHRAEIAAGPVLSAGIR